MDIFTCNSCLKTYDGIIKNVHHIHPVEYGGSPDDPKNKVDLCAGCHQTIHYLAYKHAKGGAIQQTVMRYFTSLGCPEVKKSFDNMTQYIFTVSKYYILVEQGVIHVDTSKRVSLHLSQATKELLKISAKNCGMMGMERYLQTLILTELKRQFPGLSEPLNKEIMSVNIDKTVRRVK